LTNGKSNPIIEVIMNLIPEKKNNRNLTEKQKSFLDNLVATEGDFKKAAELAGYSGNHYQVLKSLKEEVVDLASDVLARSAPKAAFKLVEMIDSNKPIPQASQKLNAAQTILDRVGVAKTDRVQVDHNVQGGIFILPEKQTVVIEDADFSNITEEED
jgi:phosphoribosylformylglycinamidine (FGAM) synthase-like enzyme